MNFLWTSTVASVVGTAITVVNPALAQFEDWSPNCVRGPAEITQANKATIKGELCLKTRNQILYQETSKSITLFRFKDDKVINFFYRGEPSRFDSNPVLFSINDDDWLEGVEELPSALIHQCGKYKCNWNTIKDSSGRLVIANGMSY